MRPSPLQLLQVFFRHVRVEVDEQYLPAEPPNPLVSTFVFDAVNIHSQFGIGTIESDHDRGRMFVVTLRVIVDNQPNPKLVEQKFCPYRIDVEAQGVVVVQNGAEKLAPPEDLAAVNGASLLWASLREQVLSVTSRMPAGAVILPTVNFHDLKKAPPEQRAATDDAASNGSTKAGEAKPRRKTATQRTP